MALGPHLLVVKSVFDEDRGCTWILIARCIGASARKKNADPNPQRYDYYIYMYIIHDA